jgi:hypothetical protein
MDHKGRPPAKTISLAYIGDYDLARSLVIKRAKEILRAARDAFPKWNPPPFNPKVYAKLLDIPVHNSPDLLELDALLVPTSGRFHVLCNSAIKSEGRRRFSIAHEIAHTFFEDAEMALHSRTTDRDYYSTPEALALERLCDAGAAELLMPFDDYRMRAATMNFEVRSIQSLADTYRVSLQAAAIRFVEVREEPCAVGFFHRAAKPSLEERADDSYPIPLALQKYRVLKMFRSRSFPFVLPVGKSTPRGSVVSRAALGADETECVERYALGDQVYPLKVSAAALDTEWFGDRPPTVCAVFRLP